MRQAPQTADVLVVGAGIMGCSIAFQLAKRNAGRVLVLDKGHVGQGATGRSSALVRMHYTFEPEVMLAVKSLEMFKDWENLTGQPSAFRQTGFVRIVPGAEREHLELNVRMQQNCGVNVQLLTRDELHRLEPDWELEEDMVAAYEPESGYGDGAVAATDFLAAARELGVQYWSMTGIQQLLEKGGKIQGVRTNRGDIFAQHVLLCTGQWTRDLLLGVGIDVPIRTELHHVALLRNPSHVKSGGCACIDSITTTYFRSDGPDKMLVGDFYGSGDVHPDLYPQQVPEVWFESVLDRVCRRHPKLRDAEIVRGITGVYDMSPDSRPMLGELHEAQGLYMVAGFSGMGFKIAPAIGLAISELLVDGVSRTVDITPFVPSRFAEGKPIHAPYEYQDD